VIDWWQALILALIQGLTEFLPISSSAHLVLPTLLLDWPDQGLAFDVAVHIGTLMAVLWYFRDDLLRLLRETLHATAERRVNGALAEVFCLALGTLPALVAGLFLSDFADDLRTLPVLATTTILFALLLAWADRKPAAAEEPQAVGWRAALFIGVAQAFALIPGTSRSGVTITAGLFAGLSRAAAARFSFLLSIPIIAGAGLLKSLEWIDAPGAVSWPLVTMATLVAAATAYGCIAVFLALVERVGMMPFVLYRLALGALLLVVWL